jgi:hypothetical protein
VATRGEGVLETLHAIVVQTMDRTLERYPSLTLARRDTVESWTAEALHRVFGASSIAREPATVSPPRDDDRRLIQISVPRPPEREAPREGAAPPRRPGLAADDTQPPRQDNAALAETYALASIDLSSALQRTREERDEARRRLEQLEHAMGAMEAVELGRSPERTLREVLKRITTGGGGRGATLIACAPQRTFRLVTGIGLEQDPFLRLSDGGDVLLRTLVRLRRPTILTGESDPDVTRALAPLRPEAQAVAGVPVRSPLGLHGLALLYYGRMDPLPSPTALGHLERLGRLLAAWFSVHRALTLHTHAGLTQDALSEIGRSARLALDLVRQATEDPESAASPLERAQAKLDRIIQEVDRMDALRLGRPSSPPLAPTQPRTQR